MRHGHFEKGTAWHKVQLLLYKAGAPDAWPDRAELVAWLQKEMLPVLRFILDGEPLPGFDLVEDEGVEEIEPLRSWAGSLSIMLSALSLSVRRRWKTVLGSRRTRQERCLMLQLSKTLRSWRDRGRSLMLVNPASAGFSFVRTRRSASAVNHIRVQCSWCVPGPLLQTG